MKKIRALLAALLALCFIAGTFPALSAPQKEADGTRAIHESVSVDTSASGGYKGDYVVIYNPGSVDSSVGTGDMSGLIETGISPSIINTRGDSTPASLDPAAPYKIDVDQQLPLVAPDAEAVKAAPEMAVWNVGDTKDFTVVNYSPNSASNTITFKVLYVGAHCRIWTPENSIQPNPDYHPLDEIDSSYAEAAANEFDAKFALMKSSFGDFRDTNGDGKVNLLFYNIDDGWAPGNSYVGGYFWSGDYTYNNLPMIHIDTYPGIERVDMSGNYSKDISHCYNTLVHEFQHLINYSVTNGMASWLNESFSGAAEEICYPGEGLFDRIPQWHNSYFYYYDDYYNPPREYVYTPSFKLHCGGSITAWDDADDDVLSYYAAVMLFSQYLYAQYGSTSVYSKVMKACSGYSVDSSIEALKTVMGKSAGLIWRDFFISMIADNYASGYGFRMNDGYDASNYYDIEDLYTLLSPVVYTASSANISGGGFITVKPVGGVYYPPADASSSLRYVGISVSQGYNVPSYYNEYEYRTLVDFFKSESAAAGVANGDSAFGSFDERKPDGWSGVEWGFDGEEYRVTSIALPDSGLKGTLDLTGFDKLKTLRVPGNRLSSVGLVGCSALTAVDVSDNLLTVIDVSSCSSLNEFDCSGNRFEVIDLSCCPGIEQNAIYQAGSGTVAYAYDLNGGARLYAYPDEGAEFTAWVNEYGDVVSYEAEYNAGYYAGQYYGARFTVAAPVLSLTNVAETGKIKASWKPVRSAVRYEVWRSAAADGEFKKVFETANTSYTNTSAKAGEKYYYKVIAYDYYGVSSVFSDVKYRTCDLPRPVVYIENLSSSGKLRLSWEAVDGAVSYDVYRAESKSGPYEVIANTDKLYYSDMTAEAGKAYYYRVVARAEKAAADSAMSAVRSRTCDLPRPVVSITHDYDSGKNKLTWKAIDGAVAYEVYRASSEDSEYKLMKTTSSTEYTNTSAKVGNRYWYKVIAVASDTKANSDFSLAKSAVCKLPRPVVSISHDKDTGKNKLNWDAIGGAVKYRVYRAESKDSDYKLMKTTEDTTYTNTSAVAGKPYWYKVVAVASDEEANSAKSAVKSATCDLPRPVVSISLSSGHPKLTWKKIEGAVSYKVYRAQSKTGSYTLMTTTTGLSYVNTSAVAGKTYYYRVMAIASNTNANSAYSLVKSIRAK